MCGPACLRIVAAFFGVRRSEQALALACRTSKVRGTTGENLLKAARMLGFQALMIDNAKFSNLARCLRYGVKHCDAMRFISSDRRR
jgi:ABC-type bacteriocin/lantibiotic exporter with double-glycine peptidase domain